MEDSSRRFFSVCYKICYNIVNLKISYLNYEICYVWRDTGGPLWISLSDSQFPSDMIGRGGAKMLGNLKKWTGQRKF